MLSMLRRRCVVLSCISVSSTSSSIIIPSNNKLFRPPCRPYVSTSCSDDKRKKKKTIKLHTPRLCEGDSRLMAAMTSATSASIRFKTMFSQGYYPISYYNSILSSLLDINQYTTILSLAQKFESQPPNRHPVTPDIHTWLILIVCHARSGNISSAFSLFRKIINTGHRPSTSILNDLFRSLRIEGHVYKAMLFYNYITLKGGFQLNNESYLILLNGLCNIGESQRAIHLFRQVETNIDSNYCLRVCYNLIILRLCKDRLVNQAYDLYSQMILKNIYGDGLTYHYLIYGYCILGQFKQAIALFREFNASQNNIPPAVLTEGEVKDAKTVVAVMVKCGVKPNVASYHSVIDQLYKDGGRVNNIAPIVETLLLDNPPSTQPYYSAISC